ncbi:response regulator transcription factor [Fervidibacillus halotolerans]|uniref:Heme response regulator HssR n=1 Tax=Fervidibacillus halotolerans TaxID=2980027 RepID=A0A9E8RXC4_9BACI|nr:response regulator transcription factor [Fervidibacillus halotolerans]WAA12630.1 response regulator transcription factor [Fervidibacillus halotolerans]
MVTILLVDDDKYILNLVEVHLVEEGYRVYKATDGMQALNLMKEHSFNLAVVDVMMPFMDGFELTKEIRKMYDIPIILLTAKDQLEDKEEGFASGTDDYLVKPFEPKELIFRINALLRRYDKFDDDTIIGIGRTKIDKRSYEVQVGDRTLLLPLKEFELLHYLMSHPRQVLSREQLIEAVWGIDYDGDERTVDVHVKRLRERFSKLTDDFQIRTVRGIGYSLEVKKR